MDGEQFKYETDSIPVWTQPLRWQPTRLAGVGFGVLATFIVMSLWQTTEFLYFQF
jgi:hypothetical protein